MPISFYVHLKNIQVTSKVLLFNMDVENSLFLEDLHREDIFKYNYNDLVENLLMQTDLKLYEDMDNLALIN